VYLGRRRLAQQLAHEAILATQLKSVNEKLNDVAIDYFRQRHRPVMPGTSPTFALLKGTIKTEDAVTACVGGFRLLMARGCG